LWVVFRRRRRRWRRSRWLWVVGSFGVASEVVVEKGFQCKSQTAFLSWKGGVS